MKTFADKITNVRDYIRLPFLFNHWYVAGYGKDFDRKPTAKTLLGRSIVFYRTESGKVTALQNRCLHRAFPLAEGYLDGDEIVCRYHGIHYQPDGKVTRIPCQNHTPNKKLRSYPVHEIGMFVFIWMGDALADVNKLPKVEFLEDSKFRTVHGFMPLKGNYLLMQENLNDLTHFGYLHKTTFPFGEEYLKLKTEVIKTPEGIFCKRSEDNSARVLSMLPLEVQERLSGKTVARWDGGMTVAPGVFWAQAPITIGEPGDPDGEVLHQYIVHFITPETEQTSHYWWAVSHDYAQDNDAYYEAVEKMTVTGFEEDKWAVQQLQVLLDNDKFESEELVITGDRAGILTRRVMLDWVKAEYGEGPPVTSDAPLAQEHAT